jgi:hypothetical protein
MESVFSDAIAAGPASAQRQRVSFYRKPSADGA